MTQEGWSKFGHPIFGVDAIDGQPIDCKYDDPKILQDQIQKNMIEHNAKNLDNGRNPILYMTYIKTCEYLNMPRLPNFRKM